ncbi:uncharacterized protein Z518_01361 [Rhinocladiella mackenziei CBS 650.93]|uniref:Heterokaryon incompatibility domain-containing protein n=1 Tax=Rhinocladiella mackenziei CBS 650.93 TaxID=1442369 RepID=A0A0D2IW57_9EURO|nr:uncharacterized protein Z518_01361 [Rhinocladiella mackenziei CBS 650.93]KIX10279.1 hypothetical protein Z518_01361 [Rhinocladiella mackenziei CBS 650.93]
MVDHLQLPRQLRYPLPSIPYVLRSPPSSAYDGLEFSSYPQRRGFNKDELLQGHVAGRSDEELNEFFQSWLFFGTIYEVFRIAKEKFNMTEFVWVNGDGQQLITTRPLRKHLDSWVQRELRAGRSLFWGLVSLFTDTWYERLRRIDECLDEAMKFTAKLLAPASPSSLPRDQLPNIMPEISLSIIILTSTLEWAKDQVVPAYVREQMMQNMGSDSMLGSDILSGSLPYVPRRAYTACGPAEYTLQMLYQGGWCPLEVRMFKELADPTMFYFSQLVRPPLNLGPSHANCTADKCVAYQVDDTNYRPRHRDFCGGCDGIGFLTSQVALLVSQGHIPLVRVHNQNGNPQFQLCPADGRDYIAISHVWVQGLGNRVTNTLPECQLTFVWNLVNTVYGNPDIGPVSFWIDTLCVPLEPIDERRRAITRMKEVYRGAHSVLVIDQELLRISCRLPDTPGTLKYAHSVDPDVGPVDEFDLESNTREFYMRLFVSPWSHRLWTLQEGALSKQLFIAFADGIHSLGSIVRSNHTLTMLRSAYQPAESAPMRNAHNMLGSVDVADGGGVHFGKMGPLLCYRDTSNLPDEAVCLGGILDLATDRIVNAGNTREERMLEFYRQLPKVPVGLLFLEGPKLDVPGFRWAPTSLLGMTLTLTQTLETMVTDRIEGSDQDNHVGGLLIPSLGVLLHNPQATESFSKSPSHDSWRSRLPPVFYVVDIWRALIEPGRENDREYVQFVLDASSALGSALSQFSPLQTDYLPGVVWRLTYTGAMPWSDVLRSVNDEYHSKNNAIGDVGEGQESNDSDSDLSFGFVIQQTLNHAGESALPTKKAALVANLSRRFMTTNNDGIRNFQNEEPCETSGEGGMSAELVVSGCFMGVFTLESIPPDEWSVIEPTIVSIEPDNPIVLRPKVGGRSTYWIVR